MSSRDTGPKRTIQPRSPSWSSLNSVSEIATSSGINQPYPRAAAPAKPDVYRLIGISRPAEIDETLESVHRVVAMLRQQRT